MAGTENFLAQLKSVVDPITVFSHYVTLKKSGNRYRALCPFHSEKTPSFYASDNGMFHCFGCGVGGDVVTFVMNIEKVEFKECVQLLSARYGIPLKFTSTGERKEKEVLLDLMRQAADFFHNLLITSSSGADAVAYLRERGITNETIKRFQLGWAPDSWNSLLEHFRKRDIDPSLLEKCGLAVARQKEGHYDRYRSRIIVPIHDIHGNVIAFGGRIFRLSGVAAEEAKYLNSPESALYTKSNHLFGFYFSKDAVQEKKFAILVEGYFDLIQPFQAGHTNIVASLGTSLTENQSKLLRRYTDRVVIFYDPDTAGKNAALRAIPILLRDNFNIDVATLPAGLDPDQFVRERGADAFQAEIRHAVHYDDLVLQKIAETHDLKVPSGRLAASEDLMELLASMQNPFERDRVMNRFASHLGVSSQLLQEMFGRKKKHEVAVKKPESRKTAFHGAEKELLQSFLMNPALAAKMLPDFTDTDFEEMLHPELFRKLREICSANPEIQTAELIHHFPAEFQNQLTSLIMDRTPPFTYESATDCLHFLRKTRSQRLLKQLNAEIDEASKTGNSQHLHDLLERKLELGRQIDSRKLQN